MQGFGNSINKITPNLSLHGMNCQAVELYLGDMKSVIKKFFAVYRSPVSSALALDRDSGRKSVIHFYICSISFNFASHSSSASTSNRKTLSFITSPSSDQVLDLASLVHRENIFLL
jgi:hypothetical protein